MGTGRTTLDIAVSRTERANVAQPYVGRHRHSESINGPGPAGGRRSWTSLRPVAHVGATVALATAAVGASLTVSAGPVATTGVVLADPLPVGSKSGSASSSGSSFGILVGDSLSESNPVGLREAAAGHAESVAANRERLPRVAAGPTAEELAAAEAARAEAARVEAERQAAADRAARDAQRASVLANAQKDPKAVAALMVADRGWNSAQFTCLVKLWTKESNWRWNATNRSSGAYGIPQSLPASKMATAGSDWRTNPATQIKWGLNYIAGRYGTPCGAWAHSVSHNWY